MSLTIFNYTTQEETHTQKIFWGKKGGRGYVTREAKSFCHNLDLIVELQTGEGGGNPPPPLRQQKVTLGKYSWPVNMLPPEVRMREKYRPLGGFQVPTDALFGILFL